MNGHLDLSAMERRLYSISKPRIEKVAIKDAKLRTFIADDANRDELVAHVYDITYGSIKKQIHLLLSTIAL